MSKIVENYSNKKNNKGNIYIVIITEKIRHSSSSNAKAFINGCYERLCFDIP